MSSRIFRKRRLAILSMLLTTSLAFVAYTTVAQQPTAWDGGISGVLLVGKFRTQQQLNGMLADGQRSTLIRELVGRTRETVGHYQSLSDRDLGGAGALLVYLRETGSRTDEQIKTMSDDDMRNIVIVEVGAQTGRGRDLQSLNNIDLVKLVLERPTQFLH